MKSNELEIALNSVHIRLQEAAKLYEDGQDQTESTDIRTLFEDLCESREARADELEELVMNFGLPRDADPEHLTLKSLTKAAHQAFSIDSDNALLDDRLQAEERIIEAAREAQRLGPPEGTADKLQKIIDGAVEAEQRLQNLRVR